MCKRHVIICILHFLVASPDFGLILEGKKSWLSLVCFLYFFRWLHINIH